MNVAFDSRPAKSTHGVGRYARCLLEALRDLGCCDLVETHQPRRCDVYHSPWIDGAMLRCPVPMVVTLHDLAPLKRHGQYLRSTLRFKLRYLAVQRAARVIVPTCAVADDVEAVLEIPRERIAVIPEAPAAVAARPLRGRGRAGPPPLLAARALPGVGRRDADGRTRASASPP